MATQSPLSLSAADAAACGLLPLIAPAAVDAATPPLPDDAPVVDALGQVATAASLRAQLLRAYGGASSSSPAVTEAALRVDVELELLRRRCFAARNALWGYATPVSAFDWRTDDAAAAATNSWNPSLVANMSVALRRLRHDATAERDDKEASVTSTMPNGAIAPGKKDERGVPLGAFSRERAWPPREFTARAAAKPPKQRGGKRKAPAAVMEERSIFSKVCAECATQSTPLWRKLPRDASASGKPVAAKPSPVAAAATGSGEAVDGVVAAQPTTAAVPMADVCIECYLKLQRSDLFARKKTEHERRARELKERAAAERHLERKRLKQQTQLLKKQQQQQAKSKKRQAAESLVADERAAAAAAAAALTTIKIVVKTDEVLLQQQQQAREADDEDAAALAVAVDDAPKSAKRDRKKSKKDKKKKKKKRKHQRAADSDSDDDVTPLPSPPQLSGQYEYADLSGSGRSRAARSYTTAFDDVDAEYEDEPTQPPAAAAAAIDKQGEKDDAPRRSRKAVGRSDSVSVSVSPVPPSALASSSSSRKRKNSVVAAAVIPDEPAKPSSRSARSKTPAPVEEAFSSTPAASPTTGPLSARKRARTKKESARERELRALGQYCPVCNAVYEEDDESTFVCCDSCEMWVHGSCDPTLTAASIAALAESSEKYICPLCSG